MTFEVIDDIAAAAENGTLRAAGPVSLQASARVGPIVEFFYLQQIQRERYESVRSEAFDLLSLLDSAMKGEVSGARYGATAGFHPLARRAPLAGDQTEWDHWCSRTQQAAEQSGIPKPFAQSLIAALRELEDNVHQHSGAPATGVVGYAATDDAFEFVVADAGMGVLESLRQAPDFAGLSDGGEALRLALSDGTSRFGRQSGRGYGFKSLFTALAGHHGTLRFRSGDHALSIAGTSPSLALATISQKVLLPGLIISVLCRAGTRGRNRRTSRATAGTDP